MSGVDSCSFQPVERMLSRWSSWSCALTIIGTSVMGVSNYLDKTRLEHYVVTSSVFLLGAAITALTWKYIDSHRSGTQDTPRFYQSACKKFSQFFTSHLPYTFAGTAFLASYGLYEVIKYSGRDMTKGMFSLSVVSGLVIGGMLTGMLHKLFKKMAAGCGETYGESRFGSCFARKSTPVLAFHQQDFRGPEYKELTGGQSAFSTNSYY